VADNSAAVDGGGALVAQESNPLLEKCVIRDNRAEGRGGGIAVGAGGFGADAPRLVNCGIADNRAGGLFFTNSSASLIASSILWANLSDQLRIERAMPTLSHCDIEGGWEGAGNIAVDPHFVNAAMGDYHLSEGSLCVDAGMPAGSAAVDFYGDPRPLGFAPDIGLDEAAPQMLVASLEEPGELFEGDTLGVPVRVVNPGPGHTSLDSLILDMAWLGGTSRPIHSGPELHLAPGDTLFWLVTEPVPFAVGASLTTVAAYRSDSLRAADAFEVAVRPTDGTIHIPEDFSRVQDGIDAAQPGERGVVAPGTYAEHAISLNGKAITVQLAFRYSASRATHFAKKRGPSGSSRAFGAPCAAWGGGLDGASSRAHAHALAPARLLCPDRATESGRGKGRGVIRSFRGHARRMN